MRRFRIPTIPDIGLPSYHEPGEPLQACDSAIFADAEVETPLPEKRPTAPHMPGLQRRNATQEEERYQDANQNEIPQRESPSNTTRLKKLTSLGFLEAVSDREVNVPFMKKKEDVHSAEENMIHIRGQEEQSLHELGQSNIAVIRSGPAVSPEAAGSRLYTQSGKSGKLLDPKSRQIDSSHQTVQESSNDLPAIPRRWTLWHELEVHLQSAVEYGSGIRHRLSLYTIPGLRRKARAGRACIAVNVLAIFSFVRWAALTFFRFLDKYQVREIQQAEKTNGVCSSDGLSEVGRKVTGMHISAESTARGQNEEETFLSTRISEKSADQVPGLQVQTGNTLDDKKTEETSKKMTRARRPFHDSVVERMVKDQKSGQYQDDIASKAPKFSNKDSGCRNNSQSIHGSSFETGPDPSDSASASSPEPYSHCRNRAEDLMIELDQNSMRFELKQSEIILSPLDQNSPNFNSDGGFGVGEQKRVNNLSRATEIGKQSGQRNAEVNQLTRISGSKTISPPSSAGNLKSDVRTMKDSLFRAFRRNKAEPETRFASPRSTRKTLALVADMLVKEHGCDVAVRKNGALKLRCEKTFSGGQRLRMRLAFQSMDAFSCNVIVCRSRDDDLQVSTTDYVAFIADIQRLFLNTTSEGIHGTRSSL